MVQLEGLMKLLKVTDTLSALIIMAESHTRGQSFPLLSASLYFCTLLLLAAMRFTSPRCSFLLYSLTFSRTDYI